MLLCSGDRCCLEKFATHLAKFPTILGYSKVAAQRRDGGNSQVGEDWVSEWSPDLGVHKSNFDEKTGDSVRLGFHDRKLVGSRGVWGIQQQSCFVSQGI